MQTPQRAGNSKRKQDRLERSEPPRERGVPGRYQYKRKRRALEIQYGIFPALISCEVHLRAKPTAPLLMPANTAQAIILFDGVCNLCNGFVNFIIDRDPEAVFRFAALQSEAAQVLLRPHGIDAPAESDRLLQSVILIEDETVYRRSTAALRIARHLTAPWPLLYGLVMVPKPLRDALYDGVAARRYTWFGQRDQCRMPTPDLQDRFLGDAAPSGRR